MRENNRKERKKRIDMMEKMNKEEAKKRIGMKKILDK